MRLWSLRRLWATVRVDTKLQAKNQLYSIGLAMAVLTGSLLRFLLSADTIRPFLAPALMFQMGSTACFFVIALVIFEKAQGTLGAQRVTPLRLGEYFLSKVLTLGIFATIEGLVFVTLTGGWNFRPAPLLLGCLALGGLYTLVGLALVARHNSITSVLIPDAIVFGMLLPLPVLPYFGILESPLWYLYPAQPPLLLFEAGFGVVEPWQLLYGVLGSALALALAWRWAHWAFERHVVEGGR